MREAYLIGYTLGMTGWQELVVTARRKAGLSQRELARRADTSRPAVSAYEHGRKAPTADTLERLLGAAGFELRADPQVSWLELELGHSRSCWVPDRLWRLPVGEVFAEIVLPIELNWSTPGRKFQVQVRRERARLYEILLREGSPEDLERWVDGAMLVDVWDHLVLPPTVRNAWQSVLSREIGPRLLDTTDSVPLEGAVS